MGLKGRIDTALATDGRWTFSPWQAPELRGLSTKPVVSTRYVGTVALANRRRVAVVVRIIFGPAESSEWAEGDDIQLWDERLTDALNQVEDCFPELLSSHVDYDHRVAGTRRPYIAATIRAVGP
ncbi:hypothetical protein [Candidatus Poriferisocius sp.]|uniref:hypothetical protein n=1 Tax=Candidatus Poriferisocius sp. TaxID=3101276 RepID=UPI003B025FC3